MSLRNAGFAALAVALLPSIADSQATFVANLSGNQAAVSKLIYDSFGSSHAATTLRATWRQHFAQTRVDIPFNHVRFHGVFDDDMSSYLGGKANPYLAFDTLDFLLSQGVKPTLELSFMPQALASDPSLTTFHYQGGISAPKDWAAWSTFVTGFVTLLVERYGVEEVRTWRHEVWNEPNCGFYYVGSCCGAGCGNQTAYFQLYKATAQAIKAVDALIPVGGPSTAQLAWIPEFLSFATSNSVPVDFVSSHLYPTDPQPAVTNHTRDGFMQSIAVAAAAAAGYAGPGSRTNQGVPFLLTEFNAGLGGRSVGGGFLDVPYAGSFLLHAHLGAQAVHNLASMSYWTFTDWGFEENGANPVPWDDKFGIRNMYGVLKPVYHAFTWLAQFPETTVPVTPAGGAPLPNSQTLNTAGGIVGATIGTVDVSVAAASASPGLPTTVTALACNYNMSDAGPPAAVTLTLNFTGLPSGIVTPTTAYVEMVDDTHGNPIATWTAAGQPLYPNSTEIAAEQAAALVTPQPVPLTQLPDGTLSMSLTLQPWAFARVTFQYGP